MGEWLRREAIEFDLILASPAVRVTETLDVVSKGYGSSLEPVWERRIYLASSATLMDVLREQDDGAKHILMVGHNPSMEDLVLDLVPDSSSDRLREAVYEKYPTSAYARLTLDIDSWSQLTREQGAMECFKRPRDLDPELGPETI